MEIPGPDLGFGYRSSIFQKKHLVAIEGTLQLAPGQTEHILEQAREYNARRKEKQPLEWPSGGSVFKRPPGHYAGQLIEDAGLKGASLGGAQVSTVHGGFIVNKGGATAADVLGLMERVRQRVFDVSKVALEEELIVIGEG